jgi:hypothetical protein
MRRKLLKQTITLPKHETVPLRIVADAAIAATGLGEGRMIPVVVIDTSSRPDVEELIRAHEHVESGDVEVAWAQSKHTKDGVTLMIRFLRPSQMYVMLDFTPDHNLALVELILAARVLYLQPGREGDRFRDVMGSESIIIEVPETGFSSKWREVVKKHLIKRFRKEGFSHRDAKTMMQRHLQEWEKFKSLRMPPM